MNLQLMSQQVDLMLAMEIYMTEMNKSRNVMLRIQYQNTAFVHDHRK